MVGIDKKLDVFGVSISGITTAIGGGILRYIMCVSIPFVFKKNIYALAGLAGSLVYYLIYTYKCNRRNYRGLRSNSNYPPTSTKFKLNMPKAL